MSKIINSLELPIDIKYINGVSIALYVLFVLLVLVSAAQYWTKNKINNLSAFVVKGNVFHNDATTIRNQLNTKIYGNFYNIDLSKTKQAFESIAWVKQTVVKRVYPNQIEVKLSEFKPKAIWGNREDLKLVDDLGYIFEAVADEDEYDNLPLFIGPEGQSKVMLDMHMDLVTVLHPLWRKLKVLELNTRGSWTVTLDSGAQVEIGQGFKDDVIARVNKFTNGVEQMLAKLNKKIIDIEFVDLRHTDGYALRMRGVTTSVLTEKNVIVKK